MVNQEIITITKTLQEAVSPKRIYLFGSFAKDTYTALSDYDFYIVVADQAGDRIDLAQQAYQSLRGVRKRPIDIIVGYETSFEARANGCTIEREVKRDGVLLYDEMLGFLYEG